MFICWYIVRTTWIIRWCGRSLKKGLTESCINLTLTPGKFFTCTLHFPPYVKDQILYHVWQCCQPELSLSLFALECQLHRQLLLFGLILNSCIQAITTLIFFTNFISRIAIYVCTYNIIAICVVINCLFVSFKIFIDIFSWLCNLFNWFKWIIYFWSKQIDIFFAFF